MRSKDYDLINQKLKTTIYIMLLIIRPDIYVFNKYDSASFITDVHNEFVIYIVSGGA